VATSPSSLATPELTHQPAHPAARVILPYIPVDISRSTNEEAAYWQTLAQDDPPFSVADGYVFSGEREFPPMDAVSWVGLYPLAVGLMQGKRPRPPTYTKEDENAFAQRDLPWGILRRHFFWQRDMQFNAIRRFLHEWRITPNSASPRMQEDVGNDERVLGLYEFEDRKQVNSYIHRWQENPELRNEAVRQHQCILSRAVDLICSEVVDNAFSHSRLELTKGKVRIMAKVCQVDSCVRDLALDARWHHLGSAERTLYTLCRDAGIPHLQLVVADGGRGFENNEDLANLWLEAHASSTPTTAQLIKFALRGDVTTKAPMRIYLDWNRSVNQRRLYQPKVHGLSEVFQTVKRLRGLWRIHSGKTCVEYAAMNDPDLSVEAGTELTAMPVKGCLHYVAIPLFSQEEPSPSSRRMSGWTGTTEIAPKSSVIDLAEFLTRKPTQPHLTASDKDIRLDLAQFWRTLRGIQQQNNHYQVVFYVRCLGLLKDTTRMLACAAVLDAITRLGARFIPILAGLDVATLSSFRRFMGPESFVGHAKVIPALLWTEARPAEAVEFILGPGAQKVANEIARVATRKDAELIKSELVPDAWAALTAVVEANPALFRPAMAGTEPCIRLQVTTPLDLEHDLTLQYLADSRISFRTLRYELDSAQAILRRGLESKQLVRLGIVHDYYMHLGRLVADESIRAAIIRCFLMHLQSPGFLPQLTRQPKDFEFVALLHPAIEVARAMAEVPPFTGTNVVAVRRRADSRFDHSSLIGLAGKQVVLILDMVHTGDMARSLLQAFDRLSTSVLAILTIVDAHPTPELRGLPIKSFCRCSDHELDQLASPLPGEAPP
jgi:hypothetical protein